MTKNKLKCSICNIPHDDPNGYNASPINNGKCCGVCSTEVVQPIKLNLLLDANPSAIKEIKRKIRNVR